MWTEEEVDWFVCNVGSFHASRAMDPSVGVAEDENIKRWLLMSDQVLVKAVAKAVGAEGMATLVAHFVQAEAWLEAAALEWAAATAAPTTQATSRSRWPP